MPYIAEILLVLGVLVLCAAAGLAFGIPAALAVAGAALIGVALHIDKARG